MSDGYLSKDRQHLARLQRERRKRMTRIDYMPGNEARAVFLAVLGTKRPGSLAATNSAVLDAIVKEWAKLTGIKKPEVLTPKTSADGPELSDAKRARAYDFGGIVPNEAAQVRMQLQRASLEKAICGARRHRDGMPCRALREPGKQRCRFHGGRSTGPRTEAGKVRALRNLRQFRPVELP